MSDPMWMKAMLGTHIAAGATAFLMAPIALATAKGGKNHRRWGKVYFWAMGVVAVTAIVMSLYRPILFLALVAVFSFYASFSAYRVLSLKDLANGGKATPLDWGAAGFTMAASASLALLGAFRPAAVQGMGIVSVVFGIIGMRLAWMSMQTFLKRQEKMFWWYGHMQGMMASYIAAWTAFSAVTLSRFFGNTWYVWLWPTILGVPCIALWERHYRRKFSPEKTEAVAA